MMILFCSMITLVIWGSLSASYKTTAAFFLAVVSLFELSFSSYYLKSWSVFNESVLGKLLILLSLFVLMSMICVSQVESLRSDGYLLSLLILILSVVLVIFFMSNTTLLMYTTFELSLIPIFMIIMGWGYQIERLFASTSMMFYTLTASLPLLASLVFLNSTCGTSSISSLLFMISVNEMVSLSLAGAFLVKTPMFLVHLWLPKAHVEAPVYGSMLLAALLLKLGTWGLYLFFLMTYQSLSLILIFSISFTGCMVTSIACIRMLDMKLIIAYSSVAHMALVVMVLLICNLNSEVSALGVMITHGYTSAPLFYLTYLQYKRSHSRCLLLNKSTLGSMTTLSLCWFLILMLNMAAPPSLNLLMELLVIVNVLNHLKFLIVGLAICVMASTAYSLIIYASINQTQNSIKSCEENLSFMELLNVLAYVPLGMMTIIISSQVL